MNVPSSVPEIPNPLKYILGYASGFVFLVAIIIYLYMIIVDNLEESTHTKEETIWIYGFLVVLVVGFVISYYIISMSNFIENSEIEIEKRTLGFGGVSKFPSRASYGKPKVLRSSKFSI